MRESGIDDEGGASLRDSGRVLTLRTLAVRVNVEATRELYTEMLPPDVHCCNACATFALAIEREAYPHELLEFLRAAGVDPARPAEAWGAPDAGYLGVWWPFIPDSTGDDSMTMEEQVEVAPGLTIEVTAHYPRPDAVTQRGDAPALDVNWVSDDLVKLELEAWPSIPDKS